MAVIAAWASVSGTGLTKTRRGRRRRDACRSGRITNPTAPFLPADIVTQILNFDVPATIDNIRCSHCRPPAA